MIDMLLCRSSLAATIAEHVVAVVVAVAAIVLVRCHDSRRFCSALVTDMGARVLKTSRMHCQHAFIYIASNARFSMGQIKVPWWQPTESTTQLLTVQDDLPQTVQKQLLTIYTSDLATPDLCVAGAVSCRTGISLCSCLFMRKWHRRCILSRNLVSICIVSACSRSERSHAMQPSKHPVEIIWRWDVSSVYCIFRKYYYWDVLNGSESKKVSSWKVIHSYSFLW